MLLIKILENIEKYQNLMFRIRQKEHLSIHSSSLFSRYIYALSNWRNNSILNISTNCYFYLNTDCENFFVIGYSFIALFLFIIEYFIVRIYYNLFH